MKSLYKSFFKHIFIYSFLLLMIFACTTPGSDDKDGNDGNPAAPTNLSVERDQYSNSLIISWDEVGDDVLYELVRVVNSGQDEYLKKSAETDYYDENYPLEKSISYKIRSVKESLYSDFSPLTEPLTVQISELPVQNVKASALEYADKIRITWDPITQAGVTPVYTVQRFTSKTNANEDAQFSTQSDFKEDIDGSLYFEDMKDVFGLPSSQTPYYYRVIWQDSTTGESGEPSKFAFGIYSSEGNDHNYEPNNDVVKTKKIINGLPDNINFVSFRYEDGGVVDEDVDWYKYENPPNMIIFEVGLTGGTIQSLCFEFQYKGEKQDGPRILGSPYSYIFDKNGFQNPISSDENLYIKIFPDGESGKGIGTYCISIQEL